MAVNVDLAEDSFIQAVYQYDDFGPGLQAAREVVGELSDIGDDLVLIFRHSSSADATADRNLSVIGGCADVLIENENFTFKPVDSAPVVVGKFVQAGHGKLSEIGAAEWAVSNFVYDYFGQIGRNHVSF